MEVKEIIAQHEEKMDKTIEALKRELSSIRTGRASTSLLDRITVDYYGTPTPIPQVASVTSPDAKTLAIQPWERSLIPAIEKAIIDSNIGLTPSNNGETIRCAVAALTEERRKELVKSARAEGENAKVVVRNARRDAVDALKKAQKNEGLSEDAEREGEDEVQKLTDKKVKEIDALVGAKEKDILAV